MTRISSPGGFRYAAFSRQIFFRSHSVLRGTVATLVLVSSMLLCNGLRTAHAQSGPSAAQPGSAQANAAVGATAPPAKAGAAKPARGSHEGIKVYGYWKIDVRNPDGSLARHVEFENALTSNAISNALPTVLLGQPVGTLYLAGVSTAYITGIDASVIGVNSGKSTTVDSGGPAFPYAQATLGPCGSVGCIIAKTSSAAYYQCLFYDSLDGEGPACFGGLSVEYPTYPATTGAATTGNATVLSGSFIATASNPVTSVWSYITYCIDSAAVVIEDPFLQGQPTPCPVPAGTPLPGGSSSTLLVSSITVDLTAYTLPTPLQVNAGQAVNISVALSFSSPSSSGTSGSSDVRPAVLSKPR